MRSKNRVLYFIMMQNSKHVTMMNKKKTSISYCFHLHLHLTHFEKQPPKTLIYEILMIYLQKLTQQTPQLDYTWLHHQSSLKCHSSICKTLQPHHAYIALLRTVIWARIILNLHGKPLLLKRKGKYCSRFWYETPTKMCWPAEHCSDISWLKLFVKLQDFTKWNIIISSFRDRSDTFLSVLWSSDQLETCKDFVLHSK